MKILFLAPQPFYQHRGTPIATKLLIEILAEHGHQIELLTYNEGKNLNISNVRINRIPSLPGLSDIKPGPSLKKFLCDIVMLWKCYDIVRKTKFDLVHAVEESVFMAMFIKLLFGIPFVYDMDSSLACQMTEKYSLPRPIHGILTSFEKLAVNSSLCVIAVCKSLEGMVRNYHPEKLLLRLEDISLLELAPQKSDLQDKYCEIKGPIVMYVGNLEEYQGIDLLLDGFRQAALRVLEAQLVIIGGSANDIEHYKYKARQLGIGAKTHFFGQKPISQLASYFAQAEMLVSPRLRGENTPMKIYSYLDSGKPLLATRLNAHTQVLDDKIALLVPPESRALAEGMVTLLEDSTLRNELAMRAKKRVQERYNYEAFQKKILGFYETIETILPFVNNVYKTI